MTIKELGSGIEKMANDITFKVLKDESRHRKTVAEKRSTRKEVIRIASTVTSSSSAICLSSIILTFMQQSSQGGEIIGATAMKNIH